MTRPAVAVILDLARVMQSQRAWERDIKRKAALFDALWRRAERWLEEGRGGL